MPKTTTINIQIADVEPVAAVITEVLRWEDGLCEHLNNAEVCQEWRDSDLGQAVARFRAFRRERAE